MTGSISTLRPVEALWLLAHQEDEHDWTMETALRAVLVDLSVRDLLEPEENEETFEPTGNEPNVPLRPYEEQLLQAIEGDDDEEAMVDAVYEFDFENFFIEQEVLAEREVDKDLSPLGVTLYEWTETIVEQTDSYETVLNDIRTREETLETAVTDGAIRLDQLPFVYAFPNASFRQQVDEGDIESLVIDPEAVEESVDKVRAVRATTSGATTAAVAASAAAASSACAASAAASCGGAAAAGGAAAGAA